MSLGCNVPYDGRIERRNVRMIIRQRKKLSDKEKRILFLALTREKRVCIADTQFKSYEMSLERSKEDKAN